MATTKEIAALVKRAAEVREASYVRAPEGSALMCGSYAKTVQDSADEVCADKNDAYLIGCFLFMCWNDALDWADRELEKAA